MLKGQFQIFAGVMKLLLVEDGAAQQYKIKGGAQEFSKKMAQSIGEEKVFCNNAVTSITLNEGGAEMVCDNGQIVSRSQSWYNHQVILTFYL